MRTYIIAVVSQLLLRHILRRFKRNSVRKGRGLNIIYALTSWHMASITGTQRERESDSI